MYHTCLSRPNLLHSALLVILVFLPVQSCRPAHSAVGVAAHWYLESGEPGPRARVRSAGSCCERLRCCSPLHTCTSRDARL